MALVLSGLILGAPAHNDQARAAMSDVQAAINAGTANAAAKGVTQYVVIMDRTNGQIVGTSGGNIDTPVASESLVKVMIAAYYLRANGGTMPGHMQAEMWDMIVRSANPPASKYWNNSIVPTIAGVYGLTGTYNNPPRPGYWGATHVTARDMAKLMWGVWNDPLVAPWLLNAMRNARPTDPSGSNQVFGFNAIDGDHGSKQGWGCDSYWRGPCSIGTMGWSDKVLGAVLQTGPQSAWDVMRSTSTYTTQQVVAAARVVRQATVYVANSYRSAVADAVFGVLPRGTGYAVCDWDANGTQTLATFVDGLWRLYDDNYVYGPVAVLGYGNPGDVPVCGRWAGSGPETIGVYRPSNSTFYLRTSNSSGGADIVVPIGDLGDRPLVGDWDGDGRWTVGVYRPGNTTFYLSAGNWPGAPTARHSYGNYGDQPYTGRFGNGAAHGIAVRRGSVVYLAAIPGGPATVMFGYGDPGDRFVLADWNGDGLSTQAVIR